MSSERGEQARPPARLLLESPLSSACDRPLCGVTGEGEVSHLTVLYDGCVAERARHLRTRPETVTNAAFVAVDPADEATGSGAVRAVSSPGDLTGVGMAVSDWVSERDADERAAVCLDGVSTLLQYASVEEVFRFLHALVSRCRQRGVAVHAHLTPSAHDDRTVAKLRQVFEECREPEPTPGDASSSTQVATDGGRDRR